MKRAPSVAPTIRGFRYLQELGSGGFSDVFLYEQELPSRKVAVKVLLAEGLTAADRAAFVAEANAMAKLSAHPYIVSIFHADVSDDGRPYFIMEYFGGPSLADRYKSQPLSVADALRAGIRISSAVATAHQSGLLHRDIKPANVLTNEYGWPGLTDFGISSAVEDELPLHTTTFARVNDTGGTSGSQSVGMSVPWSPPEMFDDDPKPDVRSDIFSLSATIYTLLSGRTPFEVPGASNQAHELMSRIERGAITPMSRGDVPGSLIAVLRKGMAVERSQRFATAVDFARALQRVELELSYAATPIEVPNLAVPEPQRGPIADAADETRARVVTSIAAQPVAPVAPVSVAQPAPATVLRAAPVAPAPATREAPAAEQTVIRQRAGGPADDTPTGVAPAKRSRRGYLIAAAVGIVGIGVVVGAVIWGSSQLAPPETQPTEASVDDDSGPVIAASVPSPIVGPLTISADGTSFTFSWSNPDPEDGDSFIWQRTDGASTDDAVHPTDEPTALIEGVAPGTVVCVEIAVSRNGELSSTPLEVCQP